MHIALFYAVTKLVRGLRFAWKDPEFKALFLFMLILLAVGTVFYNQVEHWSILNSLYFSVTTLTTVGLGDFTPQTDIGKIFTILYILVGIGTILSFITLLTEHYQRYNPLHHIINKPKDN